VRVSRYLFGEYANGCPGRGVTAPRVWEQQRINRSAEPVIGERRLPVGRSLRRIDQVCCSGSVLGFRLQTQVNGVEDNRGQPGVGRVARKEWVKKKKNNRRVKLRRGENRKRKGMGEETLMILE